MLEGRFSRTAIGAAGHRAAHQALEGGRVFADPLAIRILGADAEAALAEAAARPERRMLRLFIAFRSRVAEDAASLALEAGARQIVVLGAGLDTFACRVEPREGLRVFEADHPGTQAEKRRRLAAAGIAPPAHLVFAACDFERVGLAEALRAAGFDATRRAMFLWLGVTPYLTRAAALATLAFIGGLRESEVVFDYANPIESIASPQHRDAYAALRARVAEIGEPFQCFFETEELHAELRRLGLAVIEDWGPTEIRARFAPDSPGLGRNAGGHVVWAARRDGNDVFSDARAGAAP